MRTHFYQKKTTVYEHSFANLFSDLPQKNGNEGIPWNPDLDFLIEIHLDDGFLSIFGFSVLLQNANPGFKI